MLGWVVRSVMGQPSAEGSPVSRTLEGRREREREGGGEERERAGGRQRELTDGRNSLCKV